MSEVTAYPLAWPAGRPRTKPGLRDRAKFGAMKSDTIRRYDGSTYQQTSRGSLTLSQGRDRAIVELGRFGASAIVVSSNVTLRLDGLPRGGQSEPADPGVAVYFQIDKKPRVIACDRWDRVADNLAAIAKTIEAQRAMLRHGAVTADQIFEGFKALPPVGEASNTVSTIEDAAAFLAFVVAAGNASAAANIIASDSTYADCYRNAVKKLHPDRTGGVESPEWHKLQQAAGLLNKHHRC